jgi:hypothetical protein
MVPLSHAVEYSLSNDGRFTENVIETVYYSHPNASNACKQQYVSK